jgi:hypothetical protein
MAYKTFKEMASSLRASSAAGMDASLKLSPESSRILADILEAHEKHLIEDLTDLVQDTLARLGKTR